MKKTRKRLYIARMAGWRNTGEYAISHDPGIIPRFENSSGHYSSANLHEFPFVDKEKAPYFLRDFHIEKCKPAKFSQADPLYFKKELQVIAKRKLWLRKIEKEILHANVQEDRFPGKLEGRITCVFPNTYSYDNESSTHSICVGVERTDNCAPLFQVWRMYDYANGRVYKARYSSCAQRKTKRKELRFKTRIYRDEKS